MPRYGLQAYKLWRVLGTGAPIEDSEAEELNPEILLAPGPLKPRQLAEAEQCLATRRSPTTVGPNNVWTQQSEARGNLGPNNAWTQQSEARGLLVSNNGWAQQCLDPANARGNLDPQKRNQPVQTRNARFWVSIRFVTKASSVIPSNNILQKTMHKPSDYTKRMLVAAGQRDRETCPDPSTLPRRAPIWPETEVRLRACLLPSAVPSLDMPSMSKNTVTVFPPAAGVMRLATFNVGMSHLYLP
jgi:hypothetical protein